MRTTRWIMLLSIAGTWTGLVACGSGDGVGGPGSTAGTSSTTGGRSGVGGSNAGGAKTGGTTGSAGAGSQTLVGSCNVTASGFCLTTYCVGQSVCDAMAQGTPQGCTTAGGTWATSACPTASSVGSCREPAATGDTVTTYYSSSGLTTADAQSACTSGTFSVP
jgi:hypothetical protein